MTTLVYVGANKGHTLNSIYKNFDQVIAFEPDPEMFADLERNIVETKDTQVVLVNAACSTTDGEQTLYVTGNRVASSLGDGVKEFKDFHGFNAAVIKEITVQTVNLSEFLETGEVEKIDLYVSDAQGSDLTVLKTLKERYIDTSNIGELFLETHQNGTYLYEGLYNQLDGFKELLGENYNLIHASLGCENGRLVTEEDIPESNPEFDTYWRLKTRENDGRIGSTLRA